jgi:hypothetical protein
VTSGRATPRRTRTFARALVVALLPLSVIAGSRGGAASSLPTRAAFYYPWFPEAWRQQGQNPFTSYTPARGFYSTDAATVRAQIADMQYARVSVGIASWFGLGSTTDRRWGTLISAAQGSGFKWAPYYEPEGIGNPAPARIADDLHSLLSRFRGSGTLATDRAGRPVVFVYNADDTTARRGCATVRRWSRARRLLRRRYGQTVYVDLKVFPGYASCPNRGAVDGWHEYAPATAHQDFSKAPVDGAFSVSPGYWKSGAAYGAKPFLVRDRARWRGDLARMRASGAAWQLVTTYNEWGEGTAVESATGCRVPTLPATMCDWSAHGTISDFVSDLHDTPL